MKLTPARRRGLAVLAKHRVARESNVTDDLVGYVYWQTAGWLVSEGLAEFVCPPMIPPMMKLTAGGVELARSEGLL